MTKDQRNLSFTGRIRSFRFAIAGIATMLRSQHNAWIHAVATISVVGLGVFLGLSRFEWCWIVLAIVAVWTAEALNTALEFLTDVASPEFHPIAGNAKDVAAGAVLIAGGVWDRQSWQRVEVHGMYLWFKPVLAGRRRAVAEPAKLPTASSCRAR